MGMSVVLTVQELPVSKLIQVVVEPAQPDAVEKESELVVRIE